MQWASHTCTGWCLAWGRLMEVAALQYQPQLLGQPRAARERRNVRLARCQRGVQVPLDVDRRGEQR